MAGHCHIARGNLEIFDLAVTNFPTNRYLQLNVQIDS